jgi:hypothetical protein
VFLTDVILREARLLELLLKATAEPRISMEVQATALILDWYWQITVINCEMELKAAARPKFLF